ncbi:MAG: hypothetical protein ABI680_11945 [Chthoniobacteraceae bacterium]
MDPFFTELGRTVRARWKQENFSLIRFPEIAQDALEARPPAQHVELSSLIRSFLLDDEQPVQTTSGFGQPELVVYDDPRFYIQILCWLDGTTDIHQHEFSGAFHVLAGSSLHSRFVFEEAVPITPHLRMGNLRLTETRLLETGVTVPITSGSGCIHSLFHLETPSLTAVIRTHTDPGTGPQFTYLPPHVAVDPFYHDGLTTRRKQLLDVLEHMDDPSYPDLILEMIDQLDFERGFFILQNGVAALRSLGHWDTTLRAFEKRHGALAEGVAATLDEIVRRDGLAALRSSVTDIEHRYFLALLLNVSDRATILDLIAQRIPGPPTETILRWASELCEPGENGTWLVDAEFPTQLAIDPEDQPEAFLNALRQTLGMPDSDPAPLAHEDLLVVREVFRHSSWRSLATI